jgi:hypothetical protein
MREDDCAYLSNGNEWNPHADAGGRRYAVEFRVVVGSILPTEAPRVDTAPRRPSIGLTGELQQRGGKQFKSIQFNSVIDCEYRCVCESDECERVMSW